MTFEQAAAHYESGDLRRAWEACEAAYDEAHPDHRLLHMMGLIAFRRQHFAKAQSLIGHATQLAPAEPLYFCSLSLPHFAQNDLQTGIARLDQALAISPDFLPALDQKAGALMQLGRAQDARPFFEQLAKRDPTPRRRLALALCLRSLGRLDEARSTLQALLEDSPVCGQAWWMLAGLGKASADSNHLAAMSEALQKTEPSATSADDRVPLLFALAKEHEDLEDYDTAFDFYRQANALRRQEINYDIEKDVALFKGIIKHHSDVLPKPPERQRSARADATPIFIVSMPRTGSTLSERILAAHSKVNSAGELQLVAQLVRASAARTGKAYPESSAATSDDKILEMREAYLERSRQWRGDAPFFVDKMPVNFLYLGQIARMFPEAPLIHVYRHPLDTCLSCYRQLFGDFYRFSYALTELGRWYVMYRELMAHWQQGMPGRILNLEYESLVREPEREIRQLLAHCGLEWEPGCLEFASGGTAVRTPSAGQVRREIYQDSVGRWRRYEKHLAPLMEVLGDDFVR